MPASYEAGNLFMSLNIHLCYLKKLNFLDIYIMYMNNQYNSNYLIG